ncbi:MAG: HAMP domain-containing sensor histidine kinase [Halothiobacillaceae bacterium]
MNNAVKNGVGSPLGDNQRQASTDSPHETARPLFQHLARAMAWALVAQLVLALVLTVALVLWPLTDRAAQDKAGLLVLSAQTWLELPPGTRPDFEAELRERHGLILSVGGSESAHAPSSRWLPPYPYLLQRALARRVDDSPTISLVEGLQTVEVSLWVHGQPFTLRFDAPRLISGRLVALGLVLLGSALLVGVVALLLARRLVRPLEGIARTAQLWGRGQPAPMPPGGCQVREVCELAEQLEQMMRALRRHEHDKITLLAGVSHDLRTPLARLRLALEMLPRDGAGGLYDSMVRDVEAMDRLIGQSLQLARADAMAEEETDLVAFTSQLVEELRRGGTELSFSGPARCCGRCVPQALNRILTNLIDNAWRYGGFQPVELVLDCTPARVRFEVLDRGPGIPQDMREAVFEPFVRLEASRSLSTGGSGLGLSIARQLARVQGWRLGIEPREGGGTRAWLEMDVRSYSKDGGCAHSAGAKRESKASSSSSEP